MRYWNSSRYFAGMAKLADAADLKSADPKGLWGFKSPSRYQFKIDIQQDESLCVWAPDAWCGRCIIHL